jgi:hypothetical protein
MRELTERTNSARSNSFSGKLSAVHVLLGCVDEDDKNSLVLYGNA